MTDERAAAPPTPPRYGQIDAEYAAKLATTPADEDGPVWMVNLMKYRDVADYADGRESAISGREADDLYMPIGPLAAVGAEIVFVGDVEAQFLTEEPAWDRVAVVKYPTSRAILEMNMRDDFREQHAHKEAGMDQTIVMGCRPFHAPSADALDLPDWADVPHPPTDDDPPRMVIHVLRFNEDLGGATPRDMDQYSRHAAEVAIPNGARVAAWMKVEGTLVGDGRRWDQVRFNAFPSNAAMMKVFLDPDRLEAQKEHRETAIEETYTLAVRPFIDRIAESID